MGGRRLGLWLVGLGVVFNNYVYLHDLVFDKHAGMVYVGWRSALGIALALGLVALGLRRLVRTP
jgi:hypothetical protein